MSITEDAYANKGITTVFDLLKDTTKSILLPTLTKSPIECVGTTTWTVHLQSDGNNMVTANPSVFNIADADLTLTSTIDDFTQRELLFGSKTYYFVGSTATTPPTISSQFDFIIDFQDACRTSTITAGTMTFTQAKFGISSSQTIVPFVDSIDDAGAYTKGICGEKIITLEADTPSFLTLTADANGDVHLNFDAA